MRLTKPRFAPLSDAEMSPEQDEALKDFRPGPVLNIFRTLVRAPKALTRFNAWGGYVLSRRNDLPPREREIVILRTGFLCKSGYEWTQHHRIGLREGLTEDEIERIKGGAGAGWAPADAVLIKATDELHADQFITDATWAELGQHFSDKQRMDVVFTCGQYTQVSMMLNTFGVQLDEGQTLDPDLKG
ncbi:carboxymuconolactone decarboxylase family protein [Phenylobacterium sp.]|jgi:alkylhydroperoxidase family enzyme|uniref:carboxymuconolactone decarboxylase family protein n=1 Tax=Phenylobacterium sp. TaxID=1871053 RepID=UPI002E361DB2|nr:carboxymuconolactone decarboxylase family protein [Phenylobacterium sp.]HEX3363854.1 carboxymuconolactone decarboxylase family protein [Phenylobacterium sp.]